MVTAGRCRRAFGWRLRAWPEADQADRGGVDGASWAGPGLTTPTTPASMIRRPGTFDGVPDGDGGALPPRLRWRLPAWPEADHTARAGVDGPAAAHPQRRPGW